MYYVLFKTKNDGFDLLFEMFKLFCFKRNVLLNIYIHSCSYDIYNTVHCLSCGAIYTIRLFYYKSIGTIAVRFSFQDYP